MPRSSTDHIRWEEQQGPSNLGGTMSYVESTLVSGERIEHRAQIHWAIFFGPAAIVAIGIALLAS